MKILDVKELVARLLSEFDEVIRRAKSIGSETHRFLYLISWMNVVLEHEGAGRIILVGGFAVEVLTGSTYRTLDIDIIVEGVVARHALEEFFKRTSEACGRTYLLREILFSSKGIDIVGTSYSKRKRPIKLFVNEEYIYMEPPEELIITYLSAWKYWESLEDRDKVYALVSVLWEKIDKQYVIKRAKEEKVLDFLQTVLKDLGIGGEDENKV